MATKKISRTQQVPKTIFVSSDPQERVMMASSSETVHCPNCGSLAERQHIQGSRVTRTQCGDCDYLMVTCSLTGRVIEAYAPGLFMGDR